ncbi:MAG: hypothetical protein PHG66_05400 [Candidatus Colwellbacteria bacterium]|nr:hypothetical protein [Candidatus Colwellbacteria bacterium]
MKIKKENVSIIVSIILLITVLVGTISLMGSVANTVVDALNPTTGSDSQQIKFNLEGYKALNLSR